MRHYHLDQMSDSDVKKQISKMSIAKKLNHTSLINYQQSTMEDQSMLLMFDYRRLSMERVLSELFPQGIQDKSLLMGILGKVLEGLLYLHSKKVIMKEVSKNHIYFDEEDLIKLDYFPQFEVQESVLGDEIEGDLHYLAPEILKDDIVLVDSKMDSYSFGVLAVELGEGTLLYSELPMYEALDKKQRLEGIDLSSKLRFLSKNSRKLIESCLKKEADERPSI